MPPAKDTPSPENGSNEKSSKDGLVNPELASQPLLIQVGIVIQSWVKRRRDKSAANPPSIPWRVFKFFVALGVVGAIGKVVTEKGVEAYANQYIAKVTEWRCGFKNHQSQAQKFQRAAFDRWDAKDHAGFQREYKKAIEIYEKINAECGKPKEISYQLAMAYCNGYGVPMNTSMGTYFLGQVIDDDRVLMERRQNPGFCRER